MVWRCHVDGGIDRIFSGSLHKPHGSKLPEPAIVHSAGTTHASERNAAPTAVGFSIVA